MILVMDIGNTNIKIGVFDGDILISSWRIQTKTGRTSDEYSLKIGELFRRDEIDKNLVTGIMISSVIPALNYTIMHMCDDYFKIKPLIVGPGVKTGLNIRYDNPREVGSDRIVTSVAAHKKYGVPCIVIDFGTATTFNAVSSDGEFLGGVICPGIKVSADALTTNAARLPKIELIKPETVINKNTSGNMQSGIIYGFTGMVKYIIRKVKAEMRENNIKVIATGGLSQLMFPDEKMFDVVDRRLSLDGLKFLYDLNQSPQTRTERGKGQ